MALLRVQRRRVTFEIHTLASEPLHLDDYTLEQLRKGFEAEVQATVDLRYYPESRHCEERHQLVSVDMPTEGGN